MTTANKLGIIIAFVNSDHILRKIGSREKILQGIKPVNLGQKSVSLLPELPNDLFAGQRPVILYIPFRVFLLAVPVCFCQKP